MAPRRWHTTPKPEEPTQKVGRVTGRVAPGHIGEVTIPMRGGTECFHALPFDQQSEYREGERVVVVEYQPPLTVYVSSLRD
jgi:hypothetical protein